MMSKFQDVINDLPFIEDSLKLLRDLYNAGDCNNCATKSKCVYEPDTGELVRFNCPFYANKDTICPKCRMDFGNNMHPNYCPNCGYKLREITKESGDG